MWEKNKRIIFILLTILLAAYPIAWAASNLYNSAYSPAEWYQQPSLFFRSLTNPPQVIPVMASEGYRLPVDVGGGISITIGSTTFTAAPVFSDAGGTGTLALVDGDRRIIVNVGSDTIGLLSHLASITNQIVTSTATTTSNLAAVQAATASVTAKIIEAMAQQATETLSITSAQASTTTGVADLAAQQATEARDIIAAVASNTTVQIDAGTGFKAISVASVAVDFNVPTSVGTLPAGTKVLFITSFNGATIVGSSGIASGTIWRGAGLIASGATGRIDGITSVTPGIYMLSNEASAKTNAQLEGWGN